MSWAGRPPVFPEAGGAGGAEGVIGEVKGADAGSAVPASGESGFTESSGARERTEMAIASTAEKIEKKRIDRATDPEGCVKRTKAVYSR